MDNTTEITEIDEFLAGPLVTWFASCLEMITDEKLTYSSLVDGYSIHNVFLLMNLQVHDTNVYPSVVDSAACRSRNLLAVLNNIRQYYENELNQVIVRLPDVEKLGREPKHHLHEIELLLVLLLGCAIQCPKRKGFIEKITELDHTSQTAVAHCISQVIERPGIILNAEMFLNFANAQKAMECVRQICQERDNYKTQISGYEKIKEEEINDELCEKLQLKFKTTSLKEQLRQKNDELEDAKFELKEYEEKFRNLTRIHEELVLETKNFKFVRDELDEANACVEKTEQLQRDNTRYRKKLDNFDICQAQLKILEQENKALTENKAALEMQITVNKLDVDKMRNLEKLVTKLREQINKLTTENIENHDKYLAACEEKIKLQRFVKNSDKTPHEVHRSEGIPSLKNDLLLDYANSQVAKLQADNEKLMPFIEKLKQTLIDKSAIIKSLNVQIDSLKEKYRREVIRSKNLESLCNEALNGAKRLYGINKSLMLNKLK